MGALAPLFSAAADPLPRSVLMLDQSDADSAWYAALSPAFRSTLNAGSTQQISVYSEHLDLSRFGGPRHDQLLQMYLREKFKERPIGVLVAQGSSALEFLMRSRAQLWPGVPIVFAAVDAATVARLNLPPDVTGKVRQLTFRNAVIAAQMLVANLKRIAVVGDPWERQAVRKHYKDEIPTFAAQFEIIDLIGLPMTEVRKRVAVLPERTAIIHTAVNVDGAGVAYLPRESLAAVAEVANRPVVIDVETSVGHGGTGGLVSHPALIGQETARIVLRILSGERPADIPITEGDFIKPVFDWRQLQRFGISESRLPLGSEIRFRQPSLWEQYRWAIIAVALALLLQATLITGLLLERQRRIAAEVESRRRLVELAHLNRTAAVGAMSASIAHELNQPLGAILSNTEAAELLLAANPLDLTQIKEILADIRQADLRAGEIIASLRDLLKRKDIERREIELREVIANVAHLLEPEAKQRNVKVSVDRVQPALFVRADLVHLQQVLLNLALNGMDAMRDTIAGRRRITFQTALVGTSTVEVAVADTGTGIPHDQLKNVFEPFFTTKPHGTGLGLSIVRTIVESYGGKVWVDNKVDGGAIFRFTLPLANPQPA